MAISKARAKANKKWNDANPLNITYNQKKRAARNFVNTNLSADTKIAKAINFYIDDYKNDLIELRSEIDKRLKSLEDSNSIAILFF